MCKSTEKSKIKYYNSPTNMPLIVPEYWLNKVEEYFCLRNPGNINLSELLTAHNVTNPINTTVKHVNSTEQGMVVLQKKFVESKNERLKQSICIDELIR